MNGSLTIKSDFDAVTCGKLTMEEVFSIAQARADREKEIEGVEIPAGLAVQRIRRAGVVGHAHKGKRQAQSGKEGRKNRCNLSTVPMGDTTPRRLPVVPVTGLTKAGTPYKRDAVYHG